MKSICQFLTRPYFYVIIIIIGTALKFYRLDYKLFWFDEICTVEHTSGVPIGEYPELIPLNEIKNISFYNKLLHLNEQDYKLSGQLKGLFTSAQLTPLHYPFLMLWYRIIGDDTVHYRLFGVLIYILTLPFLFLLAKNMLRSYLAGWVSASLYAVSPYINLFAQEARYYILWGFLAILLHYILLQAIRHKRIKWWIFYSLAAIMAMYTSVFSGIIIFGHLIYVSLVRRDILPRYCINLLIIIIAYLPWIYSLFLHREEIFMSLAWHVMPEKFPVFMPLLGHMLFFISIFEFFIDYTLVFVDQIIPPLQLIIIVSVINIFTLVFLVTAFVYFFRKAEKESKYFILFIIFPGFLLFYISDIIRNGFASFWFRYLIFHVSAIIIILAFIIYRKIEQGKLTFAAIYTGLVIFGIVSIFTISKSRFWYLGGYWQQVYIEDARLLSKAEKPLLITDFSFREGMVDFLVVINECKSENIDIIRVTPDINDIENMVKGEDYSEVYVFHASDELVENLKSRYGEKMDSLEVEGISPVWEIKI